MNSTLAPVSSRMPSDLVQLVLFSILMLIGLPVNISTLIYMLKRYRHAKSFLLLLHINLNISDILVLGVYVPGMMGWLWSHEWLAGNILCKVMRFIDGFVWAVSSNIMVCIAAYRLCALRSPLWISAVGHSRVPRMLVIAWAVAAITMSPQLFVWSEIQLPGMKQCVSIWTAKMNLDAYDDAPVPQIRMTENDFSWMKAYNLQSVIIVFYIPLVILVICYVLILRDIYSTLNGDAECSSALYMSEISRLSTCGNKKGSQKAVKDSLVTVSLRSNTGQEKFRRAKVRSLRITLLLILTYVVTWLPLNLLAWWMVISFDSYRQIEGDTYPLYSLVILNSVINPFIYGRCQGLKLLFSCRNTDRKSKGFCQIFKV